MTLDDIKWYEIKWNHIKWHRVTLNHIESITLNDMKWNKTWKKKLTRWLINCGLDIGRCRWSWKTAATSADQPLLHQPERPCWCGWKPIRIGYIRRSQFQRQFESTTQTSASAQNARAALAAAEVSVTGTERYRSLRRRVRQSGRHPARNDP